MKLKIKDRLKPLDYLKLAWLMYFMGIALSYAQPEPFNVFVRAELDPKMLLQGAHPDNPNFSDSSLNYELTFGLEWNTVRTWFAYEQHKEITYQKYSVGFDYNLKDFYSIKKQRNVVSGWVGMELGSIHRERDTDYTSHALYRSNESNWSIGVNAMAEFHIFKFLSLTASYNVYTAEKYDSWGNEMRPIRHTGMIGLKTKL